MASRVERDGRVLFDAVDEGFPPEAIHWVKQQL
jgi:hypothetical protein